MSYRPKDLTIRISYKCNIGCRFCYNLSLPDSDIILAEDQLLDLINQGRNLGLTTLALSGGEIFLFPDRLMSAIKKAKEIGYKTVSMVTNGFWGRTASSAKSMIAKLKQSGFAPPGDILCMSAGEFHQEWIPLVHSKHIIQAYFEAYRRPISIDFEVTKGREYLVDHFKGYCQDHEISEKMYKLQLRKSIANLGRGKELPARATESKDAHFFGKCSGINRLIVQPDGNVLPCCGYGRFNSGLVLGNIFEKSISEVMNSADGHIVFKYLSHVPFRDIHAELSRNFDIPRKFSAICEVCEAAFSKQEHVEHLRNQAKQYLPNDDKNATLADEFGAIPTCPSLSAP